MLHGSRHFIASRTQPSPAANVLPKWGDGNETEMSPLWLTLFIFPYFRNGRRRRRRRSISLFIFLSFFLSFSFSFAAATR
jgi:hypothetical protein